MTAAKTLPFAAEVFQDIASQYGTPVFVYDQAGIQRSAAAVNNAFRWSPGYTNFFAVKATPTPGILRVLAAQQMGFDCSSAPELMMVEQEGLTENGVFYTSNNTPDADYRLAHNMGAIINVDKGQFVSQVQRALGGNLPQRMAIRYNPGPLKEGSSIIGDPNKQKFGDTAAHVIDALKAMRSGGVRSLGLHAMFGSNERSPEYFGDTARLLRALADTACSDFGLNIDFINVGGGLGINYDPADRPADVPAIGQAIQAELGDLKIPILTEYGRYITGPHGYLLTRVTHGIVKTYESFVMVDTSINNMARLATVHRAYHHIDVLGRQGDPTEPMNVTGSMCANTDIFFRDHPLPTTMAPGDLVVIHDAGAHSRSNSHNYNFRLRAGEVLVRPDGTTQLIRRHETPEDLFATTRGL